MSNLPESSPRGKRFPLVFFVCGFAICNFLVLPIMNSAGPSNASLTVPLIGILVGFIAGQCGLLAIWGVLGPLGASARLIVTLAIGVLLMTSFGVGVAVVEPPGNNLGEIVSTVLFLPLVLLATQLPLWVFRLITGGRITHVSVHPAQSPITHGQFGVRHVMGGTLVVALALGLASSAMQVLDVQGMEGWIPLLVVCLYFVVVSTFATLPCLWAAMIAKRKKLATAIVALYTLLICWLLLVIMELTNGGLVPWEVILVIFLMHATLMTAILGTLHVARLCGYAYTSRRRPPPILQTPRSPFLQDDSSGGIEPADADKPRQESESPPAGTA